MATARPTGVQEQALRAAIASGNRTIPGGEYADRTIEIMIRNRWIGRSTDNTTFRILPQGARILGQFALGDRYEHEDALEKDPIAQRTDATIRRAVSLGLLHVDQVPYSNDRVMLDAGTLAILLDAYAATGQSAPTSPARLRVA